MRRFGWLVLLAAATACGSGSSGGGGGGSSSGASSSGGTTTPLMNGFDPGPAPDASKGFQLIMPIVNDIAAGQSYEYCTWTDKTLDHDVWVKETDGFQTDSGHHIIVYYTMTPQPAGQQRICADSDMAGFRFAAASGGEGVSEQNRLPGNLAVHIPAGAQLVVNHHYLNPGTAAIAQAQSAVNVLYADPSAPVVATSSLAFVDSAMSIPPGASTLDITCVAQQDFQTWKLLPHMHNWGTHITVDHISASGSTDRLFDLDWDPSYAFHPPTKIVDPSQPYLIAKGDTYKVHCEYSNDTSAPLTFGQEMCVSYAQTVDANNVGNLLCDSGQWGSF